MYRYLPFLFALLFIACDDDEALVPLRRLPYGQYLELFNETAVELTGTDHEAELRALQFVRVDGSAEVRSCNDGVIVVPNFPGTRPSSSERDPYIEQYIFHQLGRCVLGLDPNDNRYPSGDWTSLMRPEPYPLGRGAGIDYRGAKRDYYLRKLFLPDNTDAADYFPTGAVPFDATLPRTLIFDDECRETYDLDNLDPDTNFDVSIEMRVDGAPGRFELQLDDQLNEPTSESLRLHHFPGTGQLRLANDSYEYLFATYINQIPDLDQGTVTLLARRLGDEIIYYANGAYLYRTPYQLQRVADIRAFPTLVIDGCPSRVMVYTLPD